MRCSPDHNLSVSSLTARLLPWTLCGVLLLPTQSVGQTREPITMTASIYSVVSCQLTPENRSHDFDVVFLNITLWNHTNRRVDVRRAIGDWWFAEVNVTPDALLHRERMRGTQESRDCFLDCEPKEVTVSILPRSALALRVYVEDFIPEYWRYQTDKPRSHYLSARWHLRTRGRVFWSKPKEYWSTPVRIDTPNSTPPLEIGPNCYDPERGTKPSTE